MELKVPDFLKSGIRQAIGVVFFCAIGWSLQEAFSGSIYLAGIQTYCTWQVVGRRNKCLVRGGMRIEDFATRQYRYSYADFSTVTCRGIITIVLVGTLLLGKTAETALYLILGSAIGEGP